MNDKTAKRYERVCREYLVDLNGQQAATRAGYAPRNARVTASKLLTKPNIQARIAELTAEAQARVEITGDDVLRELARYAFPDTPTSHDDVFPGDRISSLDKLARHFSLYNDKVSHTVDLSKASDEELEAIILGEA